MSRDKLSVGSVRPSQILWAYGPGALIDLPSISVITMGIGNDQWGVGYRRHIEEARLLAAVRNILGPQVKGLREPPFQQNGDVKAYLPEILIGVPVRPFPRWLRCVKCGLLSEYDLGLFKIKKNRENTWFVHEGCQGSKGDQSAKNVDAVPARFLLACRNGHLDDFPWHYFVHSGPSDCKGILRFFESGASLQTENLWVKCDECGAARNMAQAFGKSGKEALPRCRGRHPHLDHYDRECNEQACTVLLGATNSWFPITLSALTIPLSMDQIAQLIQNDWHYFENIESEVAVAIVIQTLKKSGTFPDIAKLNASAVWKMIQSIRSGKTQTKLSKADIKGPEWESLTDINPPTDRPHFLSKADEVPAEFVSQISNVLLLERLREVNVLIGFTRVEAPERMSNPDEQPPRATLSASPPEWVPAAQVHGEGIFIRFSETALCEWEKRNSVKVRNERMIAGYKGWRNSRKLDPEKGYPGPRYVLLHTIAHLLIRELALECGYNAASIRERIYADVKGEKPQAGILIYTAAADSDGTLGGLVDLGKPANLGRLLKQALSRAGICSSDPLCAEHNPSKDRSLHAAACHACSFVSETSCEHGNRYIDRAFVVPTLEITDAAFFNQG